MGSDPTIFYVFGDSKAQLELRLTKPGGVFKNLCALLPALEKYQVIFMQIYHGTCCKMMHVVPEAQGEGP